MNEDAQPNEKYHRKGSDIPTIRTTRINNRYKNSRRNQAHHGNPYSSRTDPPAPEFREHSDSYSLLGDGPSFKRRRITSDDALRYQPTDLVVDLPKNCRKGAPGSQLRRRQWVALETQRIGREKGLRVRSYTFEHHAVRFICAVNNIYAQGEPSDEHSTHSPGVGPIVGIIDDSETTTVENHADEPHTFQSPSLTTHSDFPASESNSSFEDRTLHIRVLARSHPSRELSNFRVFKSGTLQIPSSGRATLVRVPPPSRHSSSVSSPDGTLGANEAPDIQKKRTASSGQGLLCSLDNENARIQTESVDDIPSYALAADQHSFQVHSQPYDKTRRILFPAIASTLLHVSLRGFIDSLNILPLRHRRTLWDPSRIAGEAIDDACVFNAEDRTFVVLGHARDHEQLSLLRICGNQANSALPLDRPWRSTKRGGVSAVANMVQPLMFATGGYDHIVHLWDINADFSSATPRQLAIKHNSHIQSLLSLRDTSHKLVSAGADCNVHLWDLSSERIVNTMRTSNSVYHVHKTSSPFCTLSEVAHRELQFEVRDHRLVPERPVQRFGYTTPQVHGRFIKGDILANLFACGARDGSVRLWDLRNIKSIPAIVECFQGQKVVEVAFNQSRLVACSEASQINLIEHHQK